MEGKRPGLIKVEGILSEVQAKRLTANCCIEETQITWGIKYLKISQSLSSNLLSFYLVIFHIVVVAVEMYLVVVLN